MINFSPFALIRIFIEHGDFSENVHISPGFPLATPWARLLASLLDSLVSLTYWISTGWFYKYFVLHVIPLFRPSHPDPLSWPPIEALIKAVYWLLLLLIYLGYTFRTLERNQCSIGKRIMRLRITDHRGGKPKPEFLLWHRWVIPRIYCFVFPPFLFIEVVYLFSKDSRTFRDRLAKTVVIRLSNLTT